MDKDKKRYILGGVTMFSIIGFTAYAIYEYKKQNRLREEVYSVEEITLEIQQREEEEIDELFESGDTDGFREEMVEVGIHEYEDLSEVMEEDEKLRHNPNSKEAREQFIFMNLAEWRPDSDDYNMLMYLFTFPFEPKVEEDRRLRDVLIDERTTFFGEGSKWNNRITWGDVVLHYARKSVFNLDKSMDYWVGLFLDNMGVNYLMSSNSIGAILKDLTNHYHFNDDGNFGMFGLDEDALTDVYAMADREPDSDVSFNIEYNEFLKNAY